MELALVDLRALRLRSTPDRLPRRSARHTNPESMARSALSPSVDPFKEAAEDTKPRRAQRRYLLAVEALARVQRPRLPAFQANIGDRRVNVVG